ncbi:disease resistance protein RUN1-like [Ziziphus jujuba]|uniref:Disease resistance protein RUN1-like n=1 Tax=Ziziphus jujuba TaxID=326968 RepID=A0ABM3ZUL4_ZIZJJ|nr:disease resistance protein RUN1-like [Ziziphus jujuba]
MDPSHVRKQKGNNATAPNELEKHFRDKIQRWRAALTEAANLSGWDSQGLVGIQKRIEKIESLLCIGSPNVRMVCVWGMGGIGKTTLATAVYNSLYSQFEGGYFLANIREESKRYGLNHLAKKLLSGLLKEAYLDMGTPFVGSNFVEKQLPRKSVLVVLDDVNNSKQLEYLAGEHVWYGPRSKIIVTTRDKQVLSKNAQSIDEVEIYEVEKLDCDEALELFHLNALRNNSLATDYADMSDQAVAYANGISLALKVLGSFLCSKSKEEWESALFKLIVVPNMEIQNVLRLSYEGLADREKEIFLDMHVSSMGMIEMMCKAY